MKATSHNFIAAAIILFFASCGSTNPRYINNPSVHNASFFREKGDLKISGAAAANPNKLFSNMRYDSTINGKLDKNVGFDVQAAYAFTDHFFLEAGAMYRSEKDRFRDDDIDTNDGSMIDYTRSMFDVGFGYYRPIGSSRRAFFNLSLGAGFGASKSTDIGIPSQRRRTHDFNFVKYRLTPSFNFFFTENARLSIAPRISLLSTNGIKTNYTEDELDRLGYDNLPRMLNMNFEPSILFQSGFPKLPWMKLDAGFHFATNPYDVNATATDGTLTNRKKLRSRKFLMSLGFSFYPFDSKYRKYK